MVRENAFDLKTLLEIIIKTSNKSLKFFADSYLCKDVSLISKWKAQKLTPSSEDLSKVVGFLIQEASISQHKVIRQKIEDLIADSALKDDFKVIILSKDNIADFMREALNISILKEENKYKPAELLLSPETEENNPVSCTGAAENPGNFAQVPAKDRKAFPLSMWELTKKRSLVLSFLMVLLASLSYYGCVALGDNSNIRDTLRNADKLVEKQKFSEAIELYNKILPKAYSQSTALYALTQNQLGNAYYKLSELEDRENNLDKAIHAYQEALKIRTLADYPLDYASTQSSLGTAYRYLSKIRDKEENLHNAFIAYQEALKIYTPEQDSFAYAKIMTQLGDTYVKLSAVQDKKENLSQAIAACDEALKIITIDLDSLWYAGTQDILGNAYLYLADIQDREENLCKAVKAYEEALKARPVEVFPKDYARTLQNLARAYSNLSRIRDKEAYTKKALLAHNESLKTKKQYGLLNSQLL